MNDSQPHQNDSNHWSSYPDAPDRIGEPPCVFTRETWESLEEDEFVGELRRMFAEPVALTAREEAWLRLGRTIPVFGVPDSFQP